jgi:hypothetical protein
VLVGATRPAHACSPPHTPPHELDATHAGDIVAPSEVTARAAILRTDDGGCGDKPDPCGDLAVIAITLEASDDATSFADLGYELRLVGGELPLGLTLPTGPVRSGSTLGGSLGLTFDGDDHAGFSFDLEIRARDLNGNLGPPTVLTIGEPGEDGCATSHGSFAGFAGVLLALAFSVRRRYRHRA